MELWIPLTIAAAFFQNIRSALQKFLAGRLSTLGAAYVRFLYALPIAVVYWFLVWRYYQAPELDLTAAFVARVAAGGVCQILFTVFLLWMFSFHNFAVGTTFSKLETVMVAIFGLLLLGDPISTAVAVAIGVSALGLVLISAGQARLSPAALLRGLWRLPTLIGLLCAASLGASVVFFRAASLSLGIDAFALAAATTLLAALTIQVLCMGVLILLWERGEMMRVLFCWKPASLVGLSGGLASIGWFSAFTLQNASYVRALGQVELIFTYVVTLVYFREKVTAAELFGTALIGGGILILLLAG